MDSKSVWYLSSAAMFSRKRSLLSAAINLHFPVKDTVSSRTRSMNEGSSWMSENEL